MIKFFRKIRYNLMEQNKTGKYFKYAIGEIVLVVIGILIALQINTWNETRKNKAKEMKILINLKADLTTTKNNLINVNEEYLKLVRKHDGILNFIAFDHNEISESMKDSMRYTGVPLTRIVDGGINALLNSDKLDLITSDSLTLLLTEYPSYVESFKEQEKTMENVLITHHRPILIRHVVLMDILSRNNRFPKLKNRVPTSDYPGLIRDRAYQNAIYDERAQTLNSQSRSYSLLLKTEKLIDLISKQLKGN